MLSGCIGTKVAVSPDNHFIAADYQAYGWFSAPIKSTGRNYFYYDLDQALRKEVDKQLQQRGYLLVAANEADFIVGYHFTTAVFVDQGGPISPFDEAMAAREVGGDINDTELHNHYIPVEIAKGILQINLADAGSGKEIWKATATRVIEDGSADTVAIKSAVHKVVPKLLKSLPKK